MFYSLFAGPLRVVNIPSYASAIVTTSEIVESLSSI